jgi:hypothetical protein
MRKIVVLALVLVLSCLCFAEDGAAPARSTIPEALRRPQRGEALRYPTDTVIGVLGQGEIPYGAYRFARSVLNAFVAGSRDDKALSAANGASLAALFSGLEKIKPHKFRLGSGREEADGAISFLVRFMGREQGMVGELYVRAGEEAGEELSWQFDDLILEDPLGLDEKQEGPSFDLPPYERFF